MYKRQDYEKIITNVNTEIKKGFSASTAAINAGTATFMSSMNPDGSFTDIPYAAGVAGDVPFNNHLTRLRTMAIAYTFPGATYNSDVNLYNKIVLGLKYWNGHIPVSYTHLDVYKRQQYGTQVNTLQVLASNDFKQVYTAAGVAQGTWTDITSRATLSTGTDNTPSGIINLSDFLAQKKPIYLAFKYTGTTGSTQKTWTISNLKFNLKLADNSLLPITDIASGGWAQVNVLNPAALWTISATQLRIAGGAATAADNEDWVISKPVSYTHLDVYKRQGLEISINTVNIRRNDFTWNTSFNISFNANKVLELADNQQSFFRTAPFDNTIASIPAYLITKGKSLGLMYGPIFDGVYQFDEFDKSPSGVYSLIGTVPTNGNVRSSIKPGDIKYKDLNGDGTVNNNDFTILGRGLPIHTGGRCV